MQKNGPCELYIIEYNNFRSALMHQCASSILMLLLVFIKYTLR